MRTQKSMTSMFAQAGTLYSFIAPSSVDILKPGKLKIAASLLIKIPMFIKIITTKDDFSVYTGKIVADEIIGTACSLTINKPIHAIMKSAGMISRPIFKKNGIGGHTWFKAECDRNVEKMVVIYHDANRAGKHLDIHIGSVSVIIRISGKPVEKLIKYNSTGELTNISKEALMEHLRNEVRIGARMPQNLDHSIANAHSQWMGGHGATEGYGAGRTRQMVFEEPVEVIHVDDGPGKTARLYCPGIWKYGQTYIHMLYPGNNKNGIPIVKWGITKPKDPISNDRLDLTKISPEQINKFRERVDPRTVTRKYDSASAHFDSTIKGTTLWSSRISKETGRRIEYTHKVPELSRVVHWANPQGMGELLFKHHGQYLSAAEAGGILNADKVRPLDVFPDFRIYRIDRWNGQNVIHLDFFANRFLASDFVKPSRIMNLPEFSEIKKKAGWEGLVGVPEGKSISEGLKIKWVADPVDWEIKDVQLQWGPKGRIAGVVWFKSLESGKIFKMGAGQIGDDKFVLQIMNDPKAFIGMVFKVKSRIGHEGRAAKVILEPHLDKGIG